MNWLITDKGDDRARALVDGETTTGLPHYSRQTPGSRLFTRNGQNLVFMTADCLAVWVTFRPTPGRATRPDGLAAWECAVFRNEDRYRASGARLLSSALIREAVALTWALWGEAPRDGLITFVKPACVASGLPGYCFRRAGWKRTGYSSDGKPRFTAPCPREIPHWSTWSWHGPRGGLLRRTLESKEDR